jgi:hypothetical protein
MKQYNNIIIRFTKTPSKTKQKTNKKQKKLKKGRGHRGTVGSPI